MKLGELSEMYPPLKFAGDPSACVTGITSVASEVKKGYVFFAMPGQHRHGADFVPEAIKNGAVAVASDSSHPDADAVFDDPFLALSRWSAALYGRPADRMRITGVTGTNGKTTVSSLIHRILSLEGPAGLMGTSGYLYDGKKGDFSLTTPQAFELHELFGRMLSSSVEKAVMEVSSHALELKRVSDIKFESAIFTNLTRDHLDFHGDLESYYLSKLKLFGFLRKDGMAVVNIDDEYGRRIADDTGLDTVSYGLSREARYRAEIRDINLKGSRFRFVSPAGNRDMTVRLIGKFNVYNSLAALAWAIEGGREMESVCRVIEEASPVPGRLEIVRKDGGEKRVVVIDYAHTPDALENVLLTLKSMEPSRLVCVFGCGGDRDRAKRPLMGKIAGLIADTVYLTSDNPRSEDPVSILLDIELGIRETSTPYMVIPDREEAIMMALQDSRPGDCVLIAGKGDEAYQLVGDERLPFSDRDIAKKYL